MYVWVVGWVPVRLCVIPSDKLFKLSFTVGGDDMVSLTRSIERLDCELLAQLPRV